MPLAFNANKSSFKFGFAPKSEWKPNFNIGISMPLKTEQSPKTQSAKTPKLSPSNCADIIHNQISGISNPYNTEKVLKSVINKDNVVEILDLYKKKYKTSLTRDINNEAFLDYETIKEYIVTPLIQRAKELKIDLTPLGKYDNLKNLAQVNQYIDKVVQLIKNKEDAGDSASQRLNLQKEYPNLPFDSKGNIDFSELTLDKIKARFPESDYNIWISTEHGESITVERKKDGKNILSCEKITNDKGENVQVVSLEHNGVQTSLCYINGKFSTRTTYNIDGDNFYVNTIEKFNENRELIKKETWNKDNTSYVEQNYSNGVLIKETKFTKSDDDIFEITEEKNILSDRLIQNITNRISAIESGVGFLPRIEEIENDILNGISKDNINEILYQYEEATGRSLIQDIIDDNMGLENKKQKELLKHLTSLTRESFSAQNDKDHYWEGQSLGYELQYALRYYDSKFLREVLDKVNKDNIEHVLSKIFNITSGSVFNDFSDSLYSQIVMILGNNAEAYIQKLIDIMVQHINEKGGYTKDLVEDFKANKGNCTKSVIDFTRLANRCHSGQSSKITGKPDGKININDVKQRGTGDCWLVASILSATNKNKKGLDYINNMLSVDANGNVTVELKGVNKKYVITVEEIEKSNHLASGDPDMRAIEIAFDKYLKEYSYEITGKGYLDFSHADINGDSEEFAYNILFGNGYTDQHPDITKMDFNDENKIYSLSFGVKPNVQATVLGSDKQSEVDLIGRHAYAIKKSDEKYIYLINPHNSSETLRVERALLQSKNPRLFFAKIDKNA